MYSRALVMSNPSAQMLEGSLAEEEYAKITPKSNAYKMQHAHDLKFHLIIIPAELFIDRLGLRLLRRHRDNRSRSLDWTSLHRTLLNWSSHNSHRKARPGLVGTLDLQIHVPWYRKWGGHGIDATLSWGCFHD